MIEGSASLGRGTILLVEDDAGDAALMQAWLRRSKTDWNVVHSETLSDALRSLESLSPDLIISDLGLPDAQGLASATSLISASPDVPLIVLTSASRPETAVQSLELGAQDCISKNKITEDTLRRSINFAITRHTAQRRLATLEGSLAIADSDLEQYASMVAHDLRAPLRTSRLLSQAIGKELLNSSKSEVVISDPALTKVCGRVSDLAERLDHTLGRLDQIVLSMLDYSNIDRSPPEVEPLQLRPIVDEVVEAVEADLQQVDATVTIDIEPDLSVSGAPTVMWRVIENLMSNSIKFRDPDRPLEIHLRASVQDRGQLVRVEVKDNGIGIPVTEANRVFLPLERLDSQTAGCGFGLAICRRHVDALGGSIWLGSEQEVGTTVIFEVPRSIDQLAPSW